MLRKFAATAATASASPLAFLLAFLVIVVWAIVRPIFTFSDTWQLVRLQEGGVHGDAHAGECGHTSLWIG
jgi:hypothetical protein